MKTCFFEILNSYLNNKFKFTIVGSNNQVQKYKANTYHILYYQTPLRMITGIPPNWVANIPSYLCN